MSCARRPTGRCTCMRSPVTTNSISSSCSHRARLRLALQGRATTQRRTLSSMRSLTGAVLAGYARSRSLGGYGCKRRAWEWVGLMMPIAHVSAGSASMCFHRERDSELMDEAQVTGEPFLVPVRLNLGVLRMHSRNGLLPPLLERLVRAPVRQEAVTKGSLAARMSATPQEKRDAVVLEAVRGVAAVVLGHESADAIDPEIPLKELGFDSLAAVELYNYLCQATGLQLPTTLGFDYPTPVAIAGYLRARMEGVDAPLAVEPSGEREGTTSAAATTVAG